MDKINLSWMRERINIISTYKPYPNKAKGSLLSAVTEGGECFEDRYWESLITTAGNGNVVIGGDFNLKGMEVDKKLKDSDIIREQFTEGNYTFKADIGEEHSGRTIDHILSKGYPCKSWVSQNGRFLSDHIPIVAEVCVTGSKKKEGRIIGNKTIPSIRPGDAGAKRRLLKEMDKIIADGLDTWTHDQLVVWTANKAKEIAR